MKPKTFLHNIEVSLQEVLEDYSNWLFKKGYTDFDIISEKPVENYLKEK